MKNHRKTRPNPLDNPKVVDNQRIDIDKRMLCKWLPPVVMAFTLPAHACTTVPCLRCPSTLVASAPVPAKCAGPLNALVGQATITLMSDSEPIEITHISHNAPGTDTITLPGLPATASSSSGINIVWQGPGSDALICLPINTITLAVTYNCGQDTENVTANVNVTEVLAAMVQ